MGSAGGIDAFGVLILADTALEPLFKEDAARIVSVVLANQDKIAVGDAEEMALHMFDTAPPVARRFVDLFDLDLERDCVFGAFRVRRSRHQG